MFQLVQLINYNVDAVQVKRGASNNYYYNLPSASIQLFLYFCTTIFVLLYYYLYTSILLFQFSIGDRGLIWGGGGGFKGAKLTKISCVRFLIFSE